MTQLRRPNSRMSDDVARVRSVAARVFTACSTSTSEKQREDGLWFSGHYGTGEGRLPTPIAAAAAAWEPVLSVVFD